jgi:hypothetical protein
VSKQEKRIMLETEGKVEQSYMLWTIHMKRFKAAGVVVVKSPRRLADRVTLVVNVLSLDDPQIRNSS